MKARAFQMTSSALSGSAESYRGEPAWCESRQPIPLRPGVANGVRTNCRTRAGAWGWSSVFFMGPPPPALIPWPPTWTCSSCIFPA